MKHWNSPHLMALAVLMACSIFVANAETYKIPCEKSFFNDQKVRELKLSDGKIIRYQYRCDTRWRNFHNDKKNLHYNGNLHYIKFYARDYNVRLSSYRIKAKRYAEDNWQAGIDIEGLGQQVDVVCEWFGISTQDAYLYISIEKKNR